MDTPHRSPGSSAFNDSTDPSLGGPDIGPILCAEAFGTNDDELVSPSLSLFLKNVEKYYSKSDILECLSASRRLSLTTNRDVSIWVHDYVRSHLTLGRFCFFKSPFGSEVFSALSTAAVGSEDIVCPVLRAQWVKLIVRKFSARFPGNSIYIAAKYFQFDMANRAHFRDQLSRLCLKSITSVELARAF